MSAPPTKALSLRQPWAWAVLTQGKRIENRQWNTKFRGLFFLHAAQGCEEAERTQALNWMRLRNVAKIEDCPPLDPPPGPAAPFLQRGGIVGRARLVGVLSPRCPTDAYPPGVDPRWHDHEQYGFILADVVALPFVPWRGMPGFFPMRAPETETP